MGNQLQKEFHIKSKPLKLPGSYHFLRFIHHQTHPLSLIIVKHPHKATPISSTLILPIKEIKNYSQSSDSVAVCERCLPLALFKPQSETQMKIVMHKILRYSAQIGRCFFYMGRIMLWCQQKRGICSRSPQQIQNGKFHEKSKVFASGMALINFLYCTYENSLSSKKQPQKTSIKEQKLNLTAQQKIKLKLKEKEQVFSSEPLPQQIRLFFQPKDKKQYYEALYTLEARLNQSLFWKNISQGLRELLLNMISEQPELRIDLETILNIPYFMESNQLRLYSALTDDLETMAIKQAKLFMTSLQLIIKQGLTIQASLMEDFFRPVLCSMITYNSGEGNPDDYLSSLVLSILIELQKPPLQVIYSGFKKANTKNNSIVRLALAKRSQLLYILPAEHFDFVISRAIFSSFQSQSLIEFGILGIPFAMSHVKHANYKKEIQFLLINKVLLNPTDKIKSTILLDGLKCMIYLIKQNLISGFGKFEGIMFSPQKFDIQHNFHVLYLYGLMIQNYHPLELLEKMMPKLTIYLADPSIFDELFVVARRCVERMLERLCEHRKIVVSSMVGLQKKENYFDPRQEEVCTTDVEGMRTKIKSEIEKHDVSKLRWILALL